MGFKIDNINFRQAVKLPAGEYSFSMKVKPTGTSLTFGYLLQGETTIATVTISDLTANQLQEVRKTFEVDKVMLWFYPAMQVNAEIHELILNKGDKAIEPQPHPLDSNYYSEARIQILRDQIALKVSQGDFESAIVLLNSAISLKVSEADFGAAIDILSNAISLKVSGDDLTSAINILNDAISLKVSGSDLLDTGINIEDKKIGVTANQFSVKTNDGTDVAVFKLDEDGNPVLKAENIDVENMVAKKLMTPFKLTTSNNTTQFQADIASGHNIIYNATGYPIYTWSDLYLPEDIKYDGLEVNIHAPYGGLGRYKVKSRYGDIFYENGIIPHIELVIGVRDRIKLIANLDPDLNQLDWTILSWSSYILKNSVRYPAYFKSGDVIFQARINSSGTVQNVISRWANGYSISGGQIRLNGNQYRSSTGATLYRDMTDKMYVTYNTLSNDEGVIPLVIFANIGSKEVFVNFPAYRDLTITIIATTDIKQAEFGDL